MHVPSLTPSGRLELTSLLPDACALWPESHVMDALHVITDLRCHAVGGGGELARASLVCRQALPGGTGSHSGPLSQANRIMAQLILGLARVSPDQHGLILMAMRLLRRKKHAYRYAGVHQA